MLGLFPDHITVKLTNPLVSALGQALCFSWVNRHPFYWSKLETMEKVSQVEFSSARAKI